MEFAWFGHELHMENKVMKSFAGDLKDLTTLRIFLVIKFYISVLKILSFRLPILQLNSFSSYFSFDLFSCYFVFLLFIFYPILAAFNSFHIYFVFFHVIELSISYHSKEGFTLHFLISQHKSHYYFTLNISPCQSMKQSPFSNEQLEIQ